MRCPFCGEDNDRVVDSRAMPDGNAIRRRRECNSCNRRYTTYEKIDEIPFMVIKKDLSRETYDRVKIESGIWKACEKRPVSADQIQQIIDKIERHIYNNYEKEVPSSVIGEMIVESLREVDHVAYVRFASVYKEFKDINQFVNELKGLLDAKK